MSLHLVKLEAGPGVVTALVVRGDRMTAFATILESVGNSYMEWQGLKEDGPRQQMPAEDVEKVVAGIRELHEMIVGWQGTDPRPEADPPLPCIVADLMRKCMQTFLDQQQIVCYALEVVAQLWDDHFLTELTKISDMPNLYTQLRTCVFNAIKRHGRVWMKQTKSPSALTGMTNIGPDTLNQAEIDPCLAQARKMMAEKKVTDVPLHKVVRCAISLISVLHWELMSTPWEAYYLIEVSWFARWLINTFQGGVGEARHPGALGCELLYQIAVRNMTGAQARVVPHDAETQRWFRE